jgi:hypothetical protein
MDGIVEWLQHPDRHRQTDVLAARVTERTPDAIKVFMKLTRTTIVTATYNTEHLVRIRRHGPGRLSSSSVSLRIAELDQAGTADEREHPPGRDRGFLWRLNSYWRYKAVEGGVIVECESVSLSRDVPALVSAIASPLIDRVARESLTRTMQSVRDGLRVSRGSQALGGLVQPIGVRSSQMHHETAAPTATARLRNAGAIRTTGVAITARTIHKRLCPRVLMGRVSRISA